MCTQGWGDFCTLTSDVHTSAKCTICEMYGTERSGFDFWERWRVMMLYSFPLSSGTFSPCGQCESCPPPPFFSSQGNKFKPQLQCWIFKLFKTWEAVTLGSNFSAWIFWRASILLCLTRPPHSPCVKWQHQETWGFSHHFGAMFQWPPPRGEALGLRRDLSLFLSGSKARTWPL